MMPRRTRRLGGAEHEAREQACGLLAIALGPVAHRLPELGLTMRVHRVDQRASRIGELQQDAPAVLLRRHPRQIAGTHPAATVPTMTPPIAASRASCAALSTAMTRELPVLCWQAEQFSDDQDWCEHRARLWTRS